MLDLLVIGDSGQDVFLTIAPEHARIYCDVRPDDCQLCFHYGDKILVDTKTIALGGNAANAAVSATRLGLKTALYTHIGDDALGTWVTQALQAEGVALDYLITDEQEETNYNTVISVAGERTILSYHRPRHYVLPQLEPAPWIYLSSMTAGFEALLPALLMYARQHQSKICFQPGTYELTRKSEIITELLTQTEVLILNKEEAAEYLGVAQDTPLMKLLTGLRSLGCATVVITDGEQGAYAHNGQAYFLPTLSDVERIETTGAGDAFASALVVALSKGETLPEAMRWGLMQASSVIQYIGAEKGLLHMQKMRGYLDRYASVQAVPYTKAN